MNNTRPLDDTHLDLLRKRIRSEGLAPLASAFGVPAETITRAAAGVPMRPATRTAIELRLDAGKAA